MNNTKRETMLGAKVKTEAQAADRRGVGRPANTGPHRQASTRHRALSLAYK